MMEESLNLQCLDIGNTSSNLGIYGKELIEVKSFKTKNLFLESVCFKDYILPQMVLLSIAQLFQKLRIFAKKDDSFSAQNLSSRREKLCKPTNIL